MIGHVGFYVDDLQKNNFFYRPLLGSIGYEVIFELPQCIAYGLEGLPLLEIYTGKPISTGIHIAFHVHEKKAVEAFYSQGIILGAQDNGKPDYREYLPGYYAAFIIDPNGHNLEAVFLEKVN